MPHYHHAQQSIRQSPRKAKPTAKVEAYSTADRGTTARIGVGSSATSTSARRSRRSPSANGSVIELVLPSLDENKSSQATAQQDSPLLCTTASLLRKRRSQTAEDDSPVSKRLKERADSVIDQDLVDQYRNAQHERRASSSNARSKAKEKQPFSQSTFSFATRIDSTGQAISAFNPECIEVFGRTRPNPFFQKMPAPEIVNTKVAPSRRLADTPGTRAEASRTIMKDLNDFGNSLCCD